MSVTLHTGSKSKSFPSVIQALLAMRKATQPCVIESTSEKKGSSVGWEKWYVRTPHTSFHQYVSPDGDVICDDDEFEVAIENMKEKLLGEFSMS